MGRAKTGRAGVGAVGKAVRTGVGAVGKANTGLAAFGGGEGSLGRGDGAALGKERTGAALGTGGGGIALAGGGDGRETLVGRAGLLGGSSWSIPDCSLSRLTAFPLASPVGLLFLGTAGAVEEGNASGDGAFGTGGRLRGLGVGLGFVELEATGREGGVGALDFGRVSVSNSDPSSSSSRNA